MTSRRLRLYRYGVEAMDIHDVLQLVSCLCVYFFFKWFQRWAKAKIWGAHEAKEGDAAEPTQPTVFGRAWNSRIPTYASTRLRLDRQEYASDARRACALTEIAAADAALVEYLARDPPPGHKRKV